MEKRVDVARRSLVILDGSIAIDLTFGNVYRLSLDKLHQRVGKGLYVVDANVEIISRRRYVSRKVNITKHVRDRVIREVRTEYLVIKKIFRRTKISSRTLKKYLKNLRNAIEVSSSVANIAKEISTPYQDSYKVYYITNKAIKVMTLKETLTKTRLRGKYVIPFSWIAFILA